MFSYGENFRSALWKPRPSVCTRKIVTPYILFGALSQESFLITSHFDDIMNFQCLCQLNRPILIPILITHVKPRRCVCVHVQKMVLSTHLFLPPTHTMLSFVFWFSSIHSTQQLKLNGCVESKHRCVDMYSTTYTYIPLFLASLETGKLSIAGCVDVNLKML